MNKSIRTGWQNTILGEVLTFQRGFDITKKQLKPGKYDVIFSSGFGGKHNEYKVQAPGVVIGRKGTLGKVFFADSNFWATDTTLWVKDFHGNDEKFAYYFLHTMNLEQYDCGSANPTLNRNHIHSLPVSYPPIYIQKITASILSAYDDLIENNTRRIKILETMAQTLYQEWFVKFRFPGHKQVKMVESELGLIPEGWEVNNFNSLISHHIGGGWGKDKVDKKYSVPAYVVRGTDIPSARYINTENCPLRFHTKSNFKSRKVEVGDLIFEVSGGSKGQPVGRTLLVSEALLDAFDEDLICASFCKLIRLNQSIILPEIIYLLILAMYDDGRIEKHQVQSTGISNFKFKPFLENEYVVIPPLQIQEKFGNLVIPLFELLHNLGAKNANLRKTRDLLLIKLISGQIDVENLDIDTGELAA